MRTPYLYAFFTTVLLAGLNLTRGAGPTTIPVMPEKQTLDLCDKAPQLQVVKWFKGKPVERFQSGQIYVVEFWATWCVPCKEAMPHLTELAKQLGDKATFIGVDVWEQPDDATNEDICAKVGKFMDQQGDLMGYAVAADGSDHSMFKSWLLAAHRMNIPSTFIIDKNGKVAWVGHPMEVGPILEKVVAGTWDANAERTRLQNERDVAQRRHDLMQPCIEAYQAKDYKSAISRVDAMVTTHPDMAENTLYFKFDCLIRSDTPAAFDFLKKISDDNVFHKEPGLAYGMAQTTLQNTTTLPHEDYAMLLSAMEVGQLESGDKKHNFMFMTTYAETLFQDGQIDKAIAAQQQLITDATPNVGHGVGQDWVDEQVKQLNKYKAAKQSTTASSGTAIGTDNELSDKQLIDDLTACHEKLNGLLKENTAFSDPALRKAVGPQAVVLIKQMAVDSALLAKTPKHHGDSTPLADAYLAKESALGDAEATQQIQSLATSSNVSESVRGESCQIWARWLQAGKDLAAQTAVVDDLEKLDRANLDYMPLSALTLGFSMDAASPELQSRLSILATKTMSAVQALGNATLARAAVDKALLESNIGQPLSIEGKTVTGETFTTANWKGKVIVVDFWATWCHYCVAELPTLKEVYSKYHDQGFEIVGVSNDYELKPLQKFIVDKNVPWPQLFDAKSAADEEFNEIAKKVHVVGNGIPQLMVIDRKGVVRMFLKDPVDSKGSTVAPISAETMGSEIQKLLAEPQS